MKKYLNPNSEQLQEHLRLRKEKKCKALSAYCEEGRPRNATRFWISYDIAQEYKDVYEQPLMNWLHNLEAETFGASVATFLIKGKCFSQNFRAAKWLVEQLREFGILEDDDAIFNGEDFISAEGISIYVIYRSRNNGDAKAENQFSGQFVLIQNSDIKHLGGY